MVWLKASVYWLRTLRAWYRQYYGNPCVPMICPKCKFERNSANNKYSHVVYARKDLAILCTKWADGKRCGYPMERYIDYMNTNVDNVAEKYHQSLIQDHPATIAEIKEYYSKKRWD